jgi:transcriptional regulator with XRE-family HTH domain
MRNTTETLDALILSKGLGLRWTAEAAMVGRTSIWRWINGTSFPRHAQATALALALGVSVERVLAAATASQKKRRRAARRAAARELTTTQ